MCLFLHEILQGGGHTPEFMQTQSRVMFYRWIQGESLWNTKLEMNVWNTLIETAQT